MYQQSRTFAAFALFALATTACSGGNSPVLTPGPTATPGTGASPASSASPTPVATVSPAATASPLPTATPTVAATATPTPTAVATATPMPTAVATANVLTDGGFEAEGAAAMTLVNWSKCSYAHPGSGSGATPVPAIAPASVTADIVSGSDPSFMVGPTPGTGGSPTPYPNSTVTSSPHGGTYAALVYTGTYANVTAFPPNAATTSTKGVNGICQTFVVPANGTLTAYVDEGGADTNSMTTTYADQEGDIFAGPVANVATGTPIPLFNELFTQATQSTYVNGYVERGPYLLTAAPYNLTPGQTATVFFGAYDSSPSNRYGAYMFVDDVSVSGTVLTGTLRSGAARSMRR